MFGSLIKNIAEFAGQVVGEAVHQVGETVSAIADIPSAFSDGYEKELFKEAPKPTETPKTDTETTTVE